MSKKTENSIIGQIFGKENPIPPLEPKSYALSAIDEVEEPISNPNFEATAEILDIQNLYNTTIVKSSKKLSNKKLLEDLNDKLLKETKEKDLLNPSGNIFENIKHIVGNRLGVFISKREYNDFSKVVNFIISNYRKITDDISKNNLPTKKNFIQELSKIININ
jgi:hypothetical protein